VLEGAVGRDDDGFLLVASIDDLVQEIGRVGVIGQISDLIDAKKLRAGIVRATAASGLRGIGLEGGEQVGGWGKKNRVTRQDGLMGDVPGNHGLAETVGPDEDQIAAFADKVEGEGALDHVPLDLCGPVPIEIGHGLESAQLGALKPALEAATTPLFELG